MQLHAIVSGRVQGVFFRVRTREKANQMQLTGWVKNLRNGKVEVLAEGKRDKLGKLEKWLKKGPRFANVSDLKCNFLDKKENFTRFEVRYY